MLFTFKLRRTAELSKGRNIELRRLKQDLITIFKIINNLLNVNFSKFFEFNTYGTTRGHSLKLIKPNSTNNAREFSFACRRVSCWNSLPDWHVLLMLKPLACLNVQLTALVSASFWFFEISLHNLIILINICMLHIVLLHYSNSLIFIG